MCSESFRTDTLNSLLMMMGLKDEWHWCFISYLKCVKYVDFGGVILHCSKAVYSKMPQMQVKIERVVLDKFCCVKIIPLNFRPLF
jgi:hypothetical protein